MQEEIENRTVNLAISTSKLTGRALVAAFRKYMQHRHNVKAAKSSEAVIGEQSIKQLRKQGKDVDNIEIEKTDIRDFKRILNKRCIDYAITKDSSQVPPRYLVYFKAKDGGELTKAFKEYSASLLEKGKRPSVLKQLKKFAEQVAAIPTKIREKKQERDL